MEFEVVIAPAGTNNLEVDDISLFGDPPSLNYAIHEVDSAAPSTLGTLVASGAFPGLKSTTPRDF